MQNVILSPIEIPALVNLLVSEIESRILNRQPISTTPPTTPEPIRLYGDKEAARHLGCSVMTIQALRRSGAIPFIRTGRKLIYVSNEIDAALTVQARKFNKKSTKA